MSVTKRPAVLIVDDDPDVRKILSFILAADYAPTCAANGAEALALLKRGRFALMFLDVSMPVLDGVKTLEQARGLAPALKVVMLTAEKDMKIARKCLELGAAAFVTKPFDSNLVLDEAGRLLEAPRGKSGRPWRVASGT